MQRLWEDFLAKYVKSSFELSNLSNILSGIANALSKLMTLSILLSRSWPSYRKQTKRRSANSLSDVCGAV